MTLRSRQRRLEGVRENEELEMEAMLYRRKSMEEHVEDSKRDAHVFNLAWKHAVLIAGFVLAFYEGVLLYLTVTSPHHATSNLSLCVLLKGIAVASVLCTRKFVKSGNVSLFGASVFFTGSYVAVWFCCAWVLRISFSMVHVSPLPLVYFVISHGAVFLIGASSRAAERARMEQLYSQSFDEEDEFEFEFEEEHTDRVDMQTSSSK